METDFVNDLKWRVQAGEPLISITSFEEGRVLRLFEKINEDMKANRKELVAWKATTGFTYIGNEIHKRANLKAENDALPGTALVAISKLRKHIIILQDFACYLKNPDIVRQIRDLVEILQKNSSILVFCDTSIKLPEQIERNVLSVNMPLLSGLEIEEIAIKIYIAANESLYTGKEFRKKDIENLRYVVNACKGLTIQEIENVLYMNVVKNGKYIVEEIYEVKRSLINSKGLVEYIDLRHEKQEIGGMSTYKEFISNYFINPEEAEEFGLPVPRGILLVGVPGCGKSLCARLLGKGTNVEGMPERVVLRLDVGNVMGAHVGESEGNLLAVFKLIDAIAPAVLWIDELEKAFSGIESSGKTDSGTTSRVFAIFLHWLQENKSDTIVVATANDTSKLPPELTRQGRFDKTFCVLLPSNIEREEIISIHLKKVKRNPENFDIKRLAEYTAGFTGAEIESAIVSALRICFKEDKRDLTNEDILFQVRENPPASEGIMKKYIEYITKWAQENNIPIANTPEKEEDTDNFEGIRKFAC